MAAKIMQHLAVSAYIYKSIPISIIHMSIVSTQFYMCDSDCTTLGCDTVDCRSVVVTGPERLQLTAPSDPVGNDSLVGSQTRGQSSICIPFWQLSLLPIIGLDLWNCLTNLIGRIGVN